MQLNFCRLYFVRMEYFQYFGLTDEEAEKVRLVIDRKIVVSQPSFCLADLDHEKCCYLKSMVETKVTGQLNTCSHFVLLNLCVLVRKEMRSLSWLDGPENFLVFQGK